MYVPIIPGSKPQYVSSAAHGRSSPRSARWRVRRAQWLDHLHGKPSHDAGWIWCAQVHYEMRGPGLNIWSERLPRGIQVAIVCHQLDRARDGNGIPANLGAVAIQHRVLVDELLHRTACEVPDVGMLGDHAQSQLLSAAPNDDGWRGLLHRLGLAARLMQLVIPALEGGDWLRPQSPDDLTGLVQPSDALTRRVERHAIHRVL